MLIDLAVSILSCVAMGQDRAVELALECTHSQAIQGEVVTLTWSVRNRLDQRIVFPRLKPVRTSLNSVRFLVRVAGRGEEWSQVDSLGRVFPTARPLVLLPGETFEAGWNIDESYSWLPVDGTIELRLLVDVHGEIFEYQGAPGVSENDALAGGVDQYTLSGAYESNTINLNIRPPTRAVDRQAREFLLASGMRGVSAMRSKTEELLERFPESTYAQRARLIQIERTLGRAVTEQVIDEALERIATEDFGPFRGHALLMVARGLDSERRQQVLEELTSSSCEYLKRWAQKILDDPR